MSNPYAPGVPNTHTQSDTESGLGSFGEVFVLGNICVASNNFCPLRATMNPKACLVQGKEVPLKSQHCQILL